MSDLNKLMENIVRLDRTCRSEWFYTANRKSMSDKWTKLFKAAKSEAYWQGNDWDDIFPPDIRPYEAECNTYHFEIAYERTSESLQR